QRSIQDLGFAGTGAPVLTAAGTENLISSASRILSLGVAWMTTRSPAARSLAFAGLSSLLDLDKKIVVAANCTSTVLPSAVFTATESAPIFSTVPFTWTLFPEANAVTTTTAKTNPNQARRSLQNLSRANP